MTGPGKTNQKIEIPLEDWVKRIAEHAAKKAAQCVLAEHREDIKNLYRRVRAVEIILAVLCGSGILGGGGVLLAKLLAN